MNRKYIPIGFAVLLAVCVLWNLPKPSPVLEVRHDSVFVVHTRVDTVTVKQFFPVIKGGPVVYDTVITGGQTTLICSSFPYDTTLNGYHVSGEVNCEQAKLSLAIEGHETVEVHDTIERVYDRIVEEHKPSFTVSAYTDADLLAIPEGFHLKTIGVTAALGIGPASVYLNPLLDFGQGLRLNAGLSLTLFEK